MAFMVCTEAGMPAASYSLPYVAGWADGDSKMIAATAERVITAARAIMDELAADDEGWRERRTDRNVPRSAEVRDMRQKRPLWAHTTVSSTAWSTPWFCQLP